MLLASASILAPLPARAGEPSPEEAAAAAYERGTAAFQRNDFAVAAVEYARADELAPNPVALESALKAVLRANDAALGMELWERASRARGAGAELKELAKLARERYASRAGQVTVACAACTAKIDGKAAPVGQRRWYSAGKHRLELSIGGETERREIVVVAGANVEVQPLSASDAGAMHGPEPAEPAESAPAPAPAPQPAPPPKADAVTSTDSAGGLSPAWFWIAGGLTLVAGGATIASGVDAVSKHDAYLAAPTPQTESDGRGAQTRTNVLIGVTGAAAVTTAALGLFLVRWSDGKAEAAAGVTPGGLHLRAGLRF